MTQLLYDGTMAGFLTAVFEAYEQRLPEVRIGREAELLPDAFAQRKHIATDAVKARRVWTGLGRRVGKEGQEACYHCWLSGLPGIGDVLLQYLQYAFKAGDITVDYGHPAVIQVTQTARKVWREKHRMEAFVRFRLLKDGLYYAAVEPDYNVLPIILPHFKSRYADMSWLIYDSRRRYGIHQDHQTGSVTEVTLEWTADAAGPGGEVYDACEERYQVLWKDYFKHTGIPARSNPRLHLKHIPARYWRFLTEKQG